MSLRARLPVVLISSALLASNANAADLSGFNSRWAALASDQVATEVGDSLTVLIYEAASVTNSAKVGRSQETRLAGSAGVGEGAPESARLRLEGGFDGSGLSGRSDRMAAQISVVVVGILPGGDLQVEGEQNLLANGHETNIRLTGRVRPADISHANTVLSSRLADARIEYDGRGFAAEAAEPNWLARTLARIGMF